MPVHLEPGPDNVHWGYFDARLAPRATVDSGDRLTISTVSGGPDLMPAAPLKVAAGPSRHSPKSPAPARAADLDRTGRGQRRKTWASASGRYRGDRRLLRLGLQLRAPACRCVAG